MKYATLHFVYIIVDISNYSNWDYWTPVLNN